MSPDLWLPGAAPPPSVEDFVERLHAQIERFAEQQAGGQAAVEVELRDGSIVRVLTIRPEPGYGFVTLVPFREHGTPEELIVPMGAVAGFKLTVVEEESPFGFSLPAPRG